MGEQTVMADGMSLEQQVDYWQERCFAEMDEKARLINQLQAIRNVLSGEGCHPHFATTPHMDIHTLREHLIGHYGYTWQTAHHPSHPEQWLRDDHRRSHEDETAKYLDHTHDDEAC